MIDESQALELLKKYIKNDKLRKHCLAVGKIMEKLAERLNEDKKLWKLVGLLHDLDYEIVDMKEHGLKTAEILKNYFDESVLNAIKAHNELTGIKDETKLGIALRASDQISGLIVATALVMPSKKLEEVKVKSLKKKFKQKDFARKINRETIKEIEKVGIKLEEFFEISLNALKEISEDLGL